MSQLYQDQALLFYVFLSIDHQRLHLMDGSIQRLIKIRNFTQISQTINYTYSSQQYFKENHMKALVTVVSISAILSTFAFAFAEADAMGSKPYNQPMQNDQGQGMRPNGDNRQDMGQDRREERREDMRQDRRQDGGQGMDRQERRQEMRENRGGGQGAGGMRRGRH